MQTLTLILMASWDTANPPCFSDFTAPRRECVEHLVQHLAVAPARAFRHMEGVIGALDPGQGGALAQALDHRLEQARLRQPVGGALQEQHRNRNVGKMRGALARGLHGRMQGKAEESEPLYPLKRPLRLRLRGHAPAKGPSARYQR